MKPLLTALALATGLCSAQDQARSILDATDFQGGLIIHVGCGDGSLTAALRQADNCVVHGLDTNPKHLAAARAAISSRGIYGPVSVMRINSPSFAILLVSEMRTVSCIDELRF